MKLEVGMYVRTKDGFLWKPKKIEIEEDNSVWFDDYYDYDVSDVKASHNIIDLIEVGDYVNGEKIIRVIPQDICGDEVLDYQHIFANNKEIFKEDIKSIVTSQQFESMSYKVGE